jgi:hypothetical protein
MDSCDIFHRNNRTILEGGDNIESLYRMRVTSKGQAGGGGEDEPEAGAGAGPVAAVGGAGAGPVAVAEEVEEAANAAAEGVPFPTGVYKVVYVYIEATNVDTNKTVYIRNGGTLSVNKKDQTGPYILGTTSDGITSKDKKVPGKINISFSRAVVLPEMPRITKVARRSRRARRARRTQRKQTRRRR